MYYVYENDTMICKASTKNKVLDLYGACRERRAQENNPITNIKLMETGFKRSHKITWSSVTYDPDGYGTMLDRSYLSMEEVVKRLKNNNVPIVYVVSGNPADDGNFHKEWESCSRNMAREDKLDTMTWWSTSGCSRWKYLEFANGKTPEEFLLKLDETSDTKHSLDIYKLYKNGEWASWLEGIDGYNVVPYDPMPIRVEITIARYGYDIKSVWGLASREKYKLNRLGSAIFGMAHPSEVDTSLLNDFTTKAMCQEFVTGLCGMNMVDRKEHPMADQLGFSEENEK